MSNDVLTFPLDAGSTGYVMHRTRKIRFGDGYAQTLGDGLNSSEDAWPVSASGPITELQPLIDFLDDHPAGVSFLWSPPHRAQARYECSGYSVINKHGNEVSVSATFVRVFYP